MRFQEFWPLYLGAHRLPGTRALHYVATVVGGLAAVEAIAAHQPLIFAVGILLAYGLAIAAHWLIEGNQPLIRVNAFWGAVADLRMCWLAVSGGLAGEFERLGLSPDPAPEPVQAANTGRGMRVALTAASAIGLSIGLSDLWDLTEPVKVVVYPAIQLGTPIVAFSSSLLIACMAHVVARRPVAMTGSGASGAHGAKMYAPACASETSLRRASLALLAIGLAAFGLAELMEHGVPELRYAEAAIAALVALL